MTVRNTIAASVLLLASLAVAAPAGETVQLIETPYMELIRDRIVHRELGLAPAQVNSIRAITDQFDSQLFITRNRRDDERRRLVHELVKRVRPRFRTILNPQQLTRLKQIELQWQGPRALLRADVQATMLLAKPQLEAIAAEVTSTDNAVRDAWKQVQKGRPRTSVDKQIQRIKSGEGRRILGRLNADQRSRWQSLVGRPAPLTRLGQGLRYKAPEFTTEMKGLNSPPLTMASLRGKVVILHFYAFG